MSLLHETLGGQPQNNVSRLCRGELHYDCTFADRKNAPACFSHPTHDEKSLPDPALKSGPSHSLLKMEQKFFGESISDSLLKLVVRLTDTPTSCAPFKEQYSNGVSSLVPELKVVGRQCGRFGSCKRRSSTRDDDNEDALSTLDARYSLGSSSESFCTDGSQRSRGHSTSTQNIIVSRIPNATLDQPVLTAETEFNSSFLGIPPTSRVMSPESSAVTSARSSDLQTGNSKGLTVASTPSCLPGTPTWSLSSEDATNCGEAAQRTQSSYALSHFGGTHKRVNPFRELVGENPCGNLASGRTSSADKPHSDNLQTWSGLCGTKWSNSPFWCDSMIGMGKDTSTLQYQTMGPSTLDKVLKTSNVYLDGNLREISSAAAGSSPGTRKPLVADSEKFDQLYAPYAENKMAFPCALVGQLTAYAERVNSGGPAQDNVEKRGNSHSADFQQHGASIPWDGGNPCPYAAALSSAQIPPSVTDWYSLAYASKRWQNLNVVLPLFIPHGVIAVIRSTGENTYVFPDERPASQLLFSGAGRVCDMWSSYLRLRVAVIHKCPEFLVPRVAQVFNDRLADLPKFSSPIRLRCSGLVKHTIQLRSSGGLTYRYDTIGQVCDVEGKKKMRVIFDALQEVLNEVNNNIAREVEDMMRVIHDGNSFRNRNVTGENANHYAAYCEEASRSATVGSTPLDCNPVTFLDDYSARQMPGAVATTAGAACWPRSKCGLEFRFSPCKELKIAIREGTLCDCAGVDSMIAGGGASSMSCWAQQFSVDNLMVGEVRLERDKTSETQLDPFFLPEHEIKTRMITKDLGKHPARVCFVHPSVYPRLYRPPVEYTLNLTPFQAAEKLCGATHRPLARMLPNGLASLIPNAFYYDATSHRSFPSTTRAYCDDVSGAASSIASAKPLAGMFLLGCLFCCVICFRLAVLCSFGQTDEALYQQFSALPSGVKQACINMTGLGSSSSANLYKPIASSCPANASLCSTSCNNAIMGNDCRSRGVTPQAKDLAQEQPNAISHVMVQPHGEKLFDAGTGMRNVSSRAAVSVGDAPSTTAMSSLAVLQKMLSEITVPYSPKSHTLQKSGVQIPMSCTETSSKKTVLTHNNALEPLERKDWLSNVQITNAAIEAKTCASSDRSPNSWEWLAKGSPTTEHSSTKLPSSASHYDTFFTNANPVVALPNQMTSGGGTTDEKGYSRYLTGVPTESPGVPLRECKACDLDRSISVTCLESNYPSSCRIADTHPSQKYCCAGGVSSPQQSYRRTAVYVSDSEKQQEPEAETDSSLGVHESPPRASKSVGGTPAHHRTSSVPTPQEFTLVKAMLNDPSSAAAPPLFETLNCATSPMDTGRRRSYLKVPPIGNATTTTTTTTTTATTEDAVSAENGYLSSMLPYTADNYCMAAPETKTSYLSE